MIPSQKWFPTSLQDRVAWFGNFAKQFPGVAADLNLDGKLTQVADDNNVMKFLGAADLEVKAYEEAVRQYRKIITEGDIGDPVPDFPANPALSLPKVINTGIFERLDKLVEQIRSADAYTNEIGALLGILPKAGTDKPDDELKPSLKAAAQPAQQIPVEFTRGKTDGITLQMQVDGAAWQNAGSFFKSPAVITVTGDATKPHQVNIRARYLDGNSPVGQYSDIVSIVSEP